MFHIYSCDDMLTTADRLSLPARGIDCHFRRLLEAVTDSINDNPQTV